VEVEQLQIFSVPANF